MAKLFIKLWLMILCTSLTSFWIQREVFSWSTQAASQTSSTERYRRQFVMIDEVLRPYPEKEWRSRFADLKMKVGSPDVFLGPSELLPLEELRLSGRLTDRQIELLRERQTISRDLANGHGFELFRTALESEYVVVVKAPFAISRPLLIFGMFTSTQFTWLVESSLYAFTLMLWLRFFRRDMLQIESAAKRIGEGHFDAHIKLSSGAPLYPIAASFNRMKDKVAALLGSHRQLTNAISHEFRTPITRLRFRHELAIEAQSLAEKDEELRAMESAINQLDELSTELLEYARLDREDPKLDIAAIDVGPWFEELVAEAQDVAESLGRGIQVTTNAEVESVDGDYRYLSRAAANLLRNAIRYACTAVTLTLASREGMNTLTIDDDGPGVPEAERERLFEPFSRLDTSRDRASGGFGIGLAIVKHVARWHSGSVSISTSPLGGARVELTWPAVASARHP